MYSDVGGRGRGLLWFHDEYWRNVRQSVFLAFFSTQIIFLFYCVTDVLEEANVNDHKRFKALCIVVLLLGWYPVVVKYTCL